MLCIGIESTAHTASVGIVDEKCRILANLSSSISPAKGGIHPREAANHHAENIVPLVRAAIKNARIEPERLDAVAFAIGPGLGPCLRTGATAARALAIALDTPLVGVNHCVSHLEIGRATTSCKAPVLLYVSGGNTQVIAFSEGRYRVFGETLDVGIGNMLDKLARSIGLGFPGGPEVEDLARKGSLLLGLPYSVKGMDVAFSGLLTAAVQLRNKGERLEDICFSVQETAFAMLTEVTERAMAHLDRDEVLLGGGVACNLRLRKMVSRMAGDRGAKMFVPEPSLCVDNGAMIAWTGLLMHRAGVRLEVADSRVNQRFRKDQVDVTWSQ